jgi:hypothetical protein
VSNIFNPWLVKSPDVDSMDAEGIRCTKSSRAGMLCELPISFLRPCKLTVLELRVRKVLAPTGLN